MSADNEFSIMEKRDEEQILAELAGQVIEEYFYISPKGKLVISYTGVKEISREYGNNDADFVEMKETDTAWIIVCKATDTERNITRGGISTQNKLEKVYKYTGSGDSRKREKDDQGNDIYTLQPDEFCIQKAFSKSQRNALNAILPVTIITKAAEAWREQHKGGGGGGTNNTQKKGPQTRRKADSEFNITDFMEPAELRTPEIILLDELKKGEGNWDQVEKLTRDWMMMANLNPENFKFEVDNMKFTVAPKMLVSTEMKPILEGIMAFGGFVPTKIKKVNGWRMNKSAVTGK